MLGLVRCDRSAVERAKWVIHVLCLHEPYTLHVRGRRHGDTSLRALSGQYQMLFGDYWYWEFPGCRQSTTGGHGQRNGLLRDARSFTYSTFARPICICKRQREHVYTATRPLLLVASPFVGGPQDDCVTSRAEVARAPGGRQRSRPVGCVEQCSASASARVGLAGV